MANISIYIKEVENVEPMVLFKLKNATSSSLSDIKFLLAPGRMFLREELFMNDHEEVATRIKAIIKILKEGNVNFSIHEMGEGHEEENADIDFWKISEETMNNILDDF